MRWFYKRKTQEQKDLQSIETFRQVREALGRIAAMDAQERPAAARNEDSEMFIKRLPNNVVYVDFVASMPEDPSDPLPPAS